MESWVSKVFIGLIVIVALDIFVLLMFVVYTMIQWCRRKRTDDILKEDEIINYEDMVVIQTKPVPLVFDDPSSIAHKDYGSPKGKSLRRNTKSEDFDVHMYLTEMAATKSSGSEGEKELKPMISISIHFNSSTNELTTVLSKGKNMILNPDGEHPHIQISAILMPDGNILHSCKGIPPNPLFKHTYKFLVKANNLGSSSVKFNVWKIDKYSRKIPFGECMLDLGNIFTGADNDLKDMWLEVQPKDKLENETMKGELLTSIQYLPSSERINVNIMRGRGFYFEDFDKDVYVKVSAVVNDKVIKNRKTSYIKRTPNPVFNEMVRLQLDSVMKLDNITIVLSVYASRSRGPHKRLIGRSFVGSGKMSSSAGREYWRQIAENPQKMVAEWQEIQ